MLDPTFVTTPPRPIKFCIKKGSEYLCSVRLANKDGTAAMSYKVTSDKDEAIILCTRAAAYAIIAAIEHHLVTGFEISPI